MASLGPMRMNALNMRVSPTINPKSEERASQIFKRAIFDHGVRMARFLDPPKVGPDQDREELFVSHTIWLATQFRF